MKEGGMYSNNITEEKFSSFFAAPSECSAINSFIEMIEEFVKGCVVQQLEPKNDLVSDQPVNPCYNDNTKWHESKSNSAITQKNNSVYFTKRESECMVWLLKGKTMKGIARQLNISPRTVESHLGAMKRKFHCYSKSQLIEKILNSNLLTAGELS
jgi:DNA-binding CsgD family transcriptional regulator